MVTSAAHDIGGFIRAQRESAQVSLRQLAQLAGVSNPYLSQIERGLRKPSAEVLAQIAKGLRVSSEVLYVQAGYLEQREHSPLRDALLADTSVTERQKQVLLEIYESFRRENDAEVTSAQTPSAQTQSSQAQSVSAQSVSVARSDLSTTASQNDDSLRGQRSDEQRTDERGGTLADPEEENTND
ncbi:MAG: helix-turn-helix transcriptional regulator [Rhodococcus sp.]|nr:helix-turn-helix transcriptional regulator [Rhodococcus sp. (in: high G+C Gram-positive bacteria)]